MIGSQVSRPTFCEGAVEMEHIEVILAAEFLSQPQLCVQYHQPALSNLHCYIGAITVNLRASFIVVNNIFAREQNINQY